MVTVIGTGRTETVESRRNWNPSPIHSASVAGWSGAFPWSSVSGGMRMTTTSAAYGQSLLYRTSSPQRGDAAVASARFRVMVDPASAPVTLAAQVYWGVYGVVGPLVTIAPGETADVVVEGDRAPEGAASYFRPTLRSYATHPNGFTITVLDGTTYEAAPTVGELFSGATPNNPPYAYSWTGATNNSESVEMLTRDVQVVPEVVDGFEAGRESRTIVHTILGRSDPDVTFRPLGMRAGTLSLVFADGAAAASAEAILRGQQVFTLTDPAVPEVGMSFVVADGDLVTRLDDGTRKVWVVEVPFREVAP